MNKTKGWEKDDFADLKKIIETLSPLFFFSR
jgi:hypothetical protein